MSTATPAVTIMTNTAEAIMSSMSVKPASVLLIEGERDIRLLYRFYADLAKRSYYDIAQARAVVASDADTEIGCYGNRDV